jgi:signal transduction histidine kinase
MTVSDNGPGVAGALQSKIFDQFFTTRPAGVGTGLGLNLCEQIINSHGGTIAVDHSPYPWWSPFSGVVAGTRCRRPLRNIVSNPCMARQWFIYSDKYEPLRSNGSFMKSNQAS